MINKVVLEAQKRLVNKPYDIYHDIGHHHNVWENCLIISEEENLKPNYENLEISAYWHDIFRDGDFTKPLRRSLIDVEIEKRLLTNVVKIIKEHPFGEKQTNLESKILYDADKLEFVSVPRFQNARIAYKSGLITLKEKEKYTKRWNTLIDKIEKTLNYGYSIKEFRSRKTKFYKWLGSIDRLRDGKATIIIN